MSKYGHAHIALPVQALQNRWLHHPGTGGVFNGPGSQLPSLLHAGEEAFANHTPPIFLPAERTGQPGSEKLTQGGLNLAIAFPIC